MMPVPRIVEYSDVLQKMESMGLRAAYYNGGVFAFPKSIPTRFAGWMGPPDDTIKAEVRTFARQVPAPFESNLAKLLSKVWQQAFPGPAWVMPAHHWAYELDFGSKKWMPAMLESISINPAILQSRTDAAAIEFSVEEATELERVVSGLLENLTGSDFAIAFPDRPAVCLLHHHKQLWWTTADDRIADSLNAAT